MPARIHELAKELGITSKQLRSTANELGIFVKSASSTVQASDARRIRDAYSTPMPRPIRDAPWAGGNNPYTPTSRHPRETNSSRRQPEPPESDPMTATIRRNLGIQRTQRPAHAAGRRRERRTTPSQPSSPVAKELLRRWPNTTPADAQEKAAAWAIELLAAPEEIIAWWDAGYHFTQLPEVKRIRQAGIVAPSLLAARVQGMTVRELLRRGEPPNYIARLLRDVGLL